MSPFKPLVLALVILAASYIVPRQSPVLVARYPFLPDGLLVLVVLLFILAFVIGMRGSIPRDGGPHST